MTLTYLIQRMSSTIKFRLQKLMNTNWTNMTMSSTQYLETQVEESKVLYDVQCDRCKKEDITARMNKNIPAHFK